MKEKAMNYVIEIVWKFHIIQKILRHTFFYMYSNVNMIKHYITMLTFVGKYASSLQRFISL